MAKISKRLPIIISGILIGGISSFMIITEEDNKIKKRINNLKNQVKKNKVLKYESMNKDGMEDWFI